MFVCLNRHGGQGVVTGGCIVKPTSVVVVVVVVVVITVRHDTGRRTATRSPLRCTGPYRDATDQLLQVRLHGRYSHATAVQVVDAFNLQARL